MNKQETLFPNWCFTFNYGNLGQPSKADVQTFYDELCNLATYVVAGWEKAPETGQEHLQGYIQFDAKKRLSQLKKLQNGLTVHWEVAKADEEFNREYCTKGGEYLEFGEARIINGGKREKKRWEIALDIVKNGTEAQRADICPQIQLQFCKQLDYIRDRYAKKPSDLPHTVRNLWIWGPTGSGKSRKAREIFTERYAGNFYNKLQNKWWDHYNDNSQPALIDDLEMETGKCLIGYLKLWLDIYVFKVEYKGGAKDVRPPFIIITSNFHPWDIFGEKEFAWYEPIMRRLDIMWLGKNGELEPQKGPALFTQPMEDFVPPTPVPETPIPLQRQQAIIPTQPDGAVAGTDNAAAQIKRPKFNEIVDLTNV